MSSNYEKIMNNLEKINAILNEIANVSKALDKTNHEHNYKSIKLLNEARVEQILQRKQYTNTLNTLDQARSNYAESSECLKHGIKLGHEAMTSGYNTLNLVSQQ